MRKLLTFLFFLFVIILGAFFFLNTYAFQTPKSPIVGVQTEAPTSVPTEKAIVHVSSPVTLVIPKLNIEADVEHVGMDAKGNMDIPKADMNVAWFEPGYKPGEKGNAVLAGHLDTKTGAPAVFWDLDKLDPGDSLLVTTADGEELKYIVTQKKIYPAESFPLQEVFGPSNTSRLNLITCEGTYSKTNRNYSHRTVVYSILQN
jgi:sortase A